MIKEILLLPANEKVTGYFIVENIRKTSASNQPALSFKLSDVSGTIPAKMWQLPANVPEEGKAVYIEGTVDVYKDSRSLKVTSIRAVPKGDVPNLADLVPYAAVSGEINYWFIHNFAEKNIIDEPLRRVVLGALDNRRNNLMAWPGAKMIHHDSIGGLMEHTANMLRMAEKVVECYGKVNTDILYSAVILHDTAKLREFNLSEMGLVSEYSIAGELLGHITLGVMETANACSKEHVSKENSLMLCHAIAAHHGKPEFGSATMPKTKEAIILHYLDMLDSRLNVVDKALEATEPGQMSDKMFGLDNVRVYCPEGK